MCKADIPSREPSTVKSSGNEHINKEADGSDSDSDSDESSDDFFTLKKSTALSVFGPDDRENNQNEELPHDDSTRRPNNENSSSTDIDFDELRDKFVTGNWGEENDGIEEEEFDGFEDLEKAQAEAPSDSEEITEALTDEQLREKNAQEKVNKKTELYKGKEGDDEEEEQLDDLSKLKADLIEKKKGRLETLEGGLKFTGFRQVMLKLYECCMLSIYS